MVRDNGGGHLDAERAIKKYDLNVSTFDVVKVENFTNYKCTTLFWYFYMWILVLLSFILIAADIYSCLNILVFKKWGTEDYKPYAYSIAKWIFTGCIIFQFVLVIYHWIWALHIYRTRNIALVYLNSICKKIYSIKSYSCFCLLNSIDEGNFHDFCCFLTYYELDNAPQILIADTPRQVINILTLRYYATGGELNNDILRNIKSIAQTNLNLSIILSFMCLSVVIYALFFFRFLFGMIMYVPLKCYLRDKEANTFKSYCCILINKSVSHAVRLHHKSKQELLDNGILSREGIAQLPELDQELPDYTDYTRVFYPSKNDSEDEIPMRQFYRRSESSKSQQLNINVSRPLLEEQPSFEQLQTQQQEEQVYSTLNNEKGPLMNRRLSTLQDKNRNRKEYNLANTTSLPLSSSLSSSFIIIPPLPLPPPPPRTISTATTTPRNDQTDLYNTAYTGVAPELTSHKTGQLLETQNMFGNQFQDTHKHEHDITSTSQLQQESLMPSIPKRSYTLQSDWDKDTDLNASTATLTYMPPQTQQHFQRSFTDPTLYSSQMNSTDLLSNHQMDRIPENPFSSSSIIPPLHPTPRSTQTGTFTETFSKANRSQGSLYKVTSPSGKSKRKKPDLEDQITYFKEEKKEEGEEKDNDEVEFEHGLGFYNNEMILPIANEAEQPVGYPTHSITRESLDIIDAYRQEQTKARLNLEDVDIVGCQDHQGRGNDKNNENDPLSVPYPVRGVSRFFEQ
ncbi:hypothetical protein LELG_05580 [Lodderomyces elongisporus NRRL YB-4239]|uniref:Vacuolar membrane protein n=1 Tax=Lodderomyces elongisporus (strain ATCC 11503 / CBS 2605 / JCM 1781 / NBRC 1676 / NRRL YB-4239) TaxID=379508 RepID=A5E7J1_LODEL|nr:hypothetical protein LELG_05580 [Lodderomyces elongisporus NRRL YB-4239]